MSEPGSTRPARTQTATEIATNLRQQHVTDDPNLAAVVAAWPELPEAIRAGIVAIVKAASGSRPDRGGKTIVCEEGEV